MAQKDTVLAILKAGKGLTSAEALYDYGIGRLASRVCDLRKAGYPIESVRTKGKNRHGETVYFDTYRLRGGAEDGSTDTEKVQ